MKAPILAAALLAAFGGSAMAEIRYDRKLEQAVLSIVAKRIGDLRGPLEGEVIVTVAAETDPLATGSIAPAVPAGSPSIVHLGKPAAAATKTAAPARAVSRVILF